jgi:hypothetical protein
VAITAHKGTLEKLPIFALAFVVLLVVVGGAFAAGWLIGKMLL